MSKYKILKEFICDDGILREVGEEYPSKQISIGNFNEYIKYGFIKEIIEPTRWRAKKGKKYHMVLSGGDVYVHTSEEENDGCDDDRYKSGNYFKSIKTSDLVVEAQKLFFEWLHTPLEITADEKNDLWARMYDAQDKAHRAVLKDNESAS